MLGGGQARSAEQDFARVDRKSKPRHELPVSLPDLTIVCPEHTTTVNASQSQHASVLFAYLSVDNLSR